MFTPYPDKNDKSIYVIPPAINIPRNPDLRPPMVVMEGCVTEMKKALERMEKSTADCSKHIREMGKLIQELKEYIDKHSF